MAKAKLDQMAKDRRQYRWRKGDCLATYGSSAKIWKEYSSTDEFTIAFKGIIEDENITNDTRAERVEEFLIAQATIAGVVDTPTIRNDVTNPNKWDKHLAPWFTAKCAETRKNFRDAKRKYGRASVRTRKAMDTFAQTCK